MPTILILAASQLNIILDKVSFPSTVLYDWKNSKWKLNNKNIRNLAPYYAGTSARILFIATSIFNLLIAYPADKLSLLDVLVPSMASAFVFMSLFTDLLILTGGYVWFPVTNWCFENDEWPSVPVNSKTHVIQLLQIIAKGRAKQYFLLKSNI